MKNWKRIVSAILALIMVVGILPVTSLRASAAGKAPLKEINIQSVLNRGIPVINLEMADASKYDTLKEDKEAKQNIQTFTLYNADGTLAEEVGITTDKTTGKVTYPLTAKGRGNSSWTMATGKKPYNLKFDKKIDLLGMGKAKSWCLIANWVDTSYMRNYMAYSLASEMGMGTPDVQQVALCINGKFEGLYALTEKVGLNEFRTEIPESGADHDVNGDGVVSEIILESDSRAYENGEPGAFTSKGGVYFVPKDPDPVDMGAQELTEIQKEMNEAEAHILSGENYKDYIDVASWVDTYIINELAKNPDFGFGYQPCYSSSYLYFREGGKVYAGPVWDFDIGFGRNKYDNMPAEGYRPTASPEGMLTANTKYYKELIEKTDFMEYVMARWKDLRKNGTLEKWMGSVYTSGYNAVSGLVQDDLAIWGGTDARVAGTFDVGRKALDFDQECTYIRNYITSRIAWLDTQWNVDSVEVSYTDGVWSRTEGKAYDDQLTGVKTVWDGGHGGVEREKANEVELGKPQGAIPGVAVQPFTLTLDTNGVGSPVCAKWYSSTDAGAGFGPEGSKSQIQVTESGRYIGFVTSAWWVNNDQSYTMGGANTTRVYIVDVGANGSVTVHDGTIYLDGTNPCRVDAVEENNHYGAIEAVNGGYLLKYQADGNGAYQIEGSGTAVVDMKLSVVDGGSQNLVVTKRAEGSQYPDVLDSFQSTYLKVIDGIPESWEISDPEVVSIDGNTRKVTALKAGTATVTAVSGNQKASVTFTVTEDTASELPVQPDAARGLCAPEYKRDNAPAKDAWATVAAGKFYRFTYTVNVTQDQKDRAASFYLTNQEKTQTLNGKADYYIFVNGTPWLKVDDSTTNSQVPGEYKNSVVLSNGEADLTAANGSLKDLMVAGKNTIEIIAVSDSDSYLDRLYLYGTRKTENLPWPPVVEPEETEPEETKPEETKPEETEPTDPKPTDPEPTDPKPTDPEPTETEPVEVQPTGVTVTPNTANLKVGESIQLTATVLPANAADKSVTWSSGNSNIASVDANGKVTARATGLAVITAKTSNGCKAEVEITVTVPTTPVTGVKINPSSASLKVGNTQQFTASVLPANATNKTVTWSSSNSGIASVDASGKVTAKSAGTATITAKTADGGYTATAIVTIQDTVVEVPAYNMTLTVNDGAQWASIAKGEKLQISATLYPTNSTDKILSWTSSNPDVASVDENGLLTANKPGYVWISARTSRGMSAGLSINVTVGVESVTISNKISELAVGQGADLYAQVLPWDAPNRGVMWTTSDANVVTVSTWGRVTAVGTGTAIVTALNPQSGISDSVEIVVGIPVTKVTATPSVSNLYVGDIAKIQATVFPANATDQLLTWSSTNENVAVVNNGEVRAVSVGSAQITAKAQNGCSVTVTVTVHAKPAENNEKSQKLTTVDCQAFDNNTEAVKEGVAFLNRENKGLVNYTGTDGSVTLKPGESIGFAAKDLQKGLQSVNVEGKGILTFAAADQPQVLAVETGTLILPELNCVEGGYTYYLLANTGTTTITLKDLVADQEIQWEVSFETLPVLYRLNEIAQGVSGLEITNASFDVEQVAVLKTVGFKLNTPMSATDLTITDRFHKNGLYGQLTKEADVLNNTLTWSGTVRPDKLTATTYTFAATDGVNTSAESVTLYVKVVSR